MSSATLWQLRQAIDAQQTENVGLQQRNRRLAAEVHDLQTGLDTVEGRKREAEENLVAAAAGFDSHHMALYAAVSRMRRGQLLGEGGQRLVQDALDFMENEGIKNPPSLANALAPGVWT